MTRLNTLNTSDERTLKNRFLLFVHTLPRDGEGDLERSGEALDPHAGTHMWQQALELEVREGEQARREQVHFCTCKSTNHLDP